MTDTLSSLASDYQRLLREHVAAPCELTRQQAYELGRAAMNASLGVFDVIRLHHQALGQENPLPSTPEAARVEGFLFEVLSPFEAAHRGVRRAWEHLEQLNGILAKRNETLACTNAQLQQEIEVRRKTADALRESNEHYCELLQQSRAMEENLRALSAQVLTAQEEERKRISRELHDEIGQALTAVNVAIALLKQQAETNPEFKRRVDQAEQMLAQSMDTVHTFARQLRPAMLDHLGIHSALRDHLATFARTTGIKTEMVTHADLARIKGQRGEVLFRVTQEALNNVFKHAQATTVRIAFDADDTTLGVEIADNGKAFSVEEKLGVKRTGRLGLLGMQERVRLVDGSFAIDSVPGKGTSVRIRIPFEDLAPKGASKAPFN